MASKFKHLLNENVFDFVERTKKLLSIEKQDDIAMLEEAYSNYTLKELQEKGLCLRRIQLTDIHTGLYGRTIIKFALNSTDDTKEKEIDHKFTVGDIVKFVENDKITGVICKSFRNQLKIAINDGVSFEIGRDLTISHKYSLLLLIDNITYKKYNQILSILSKPNIGIATNIRDLLFSSIQSNDNSDNITSSANHAFEYKTSIDFHPINKNLNPSQLHAIQCALNANDIFLIHGPPGTGKTTTVIELIYQSLIRHQSLNKTNKKTKILACAPSNIAVDNMVEKLSNSLYKNLINIVRIGHPARILDSVLNKCLESLIRGNNFKNDDKQLVDDIRQEIKANVKLLNKTSSKKERYLIYDELKNLRKELKKYEEKMVHNILNNVDVVLCTLCGADRYELKNMEFDVCIIDEAAQSLEVACWIPILKSRKIILCGDHLQLPPTIKSVHANELSYTLFDKLQEKFGNSYPPKIAMLDTQYRMNENICRFFSDTLYGGKLKSDKSVATHLLSGLEYIIKKDMTEKYSRCLETPLMVVDCAGIHGFEEDKVDAHVSKSNINEAEIVAKHVNILINAGVKCCDIAVISPYRGQVKLLREIINNEKIEIGTVDGFQGREKEAIIVSFVRSNEEHIIGFLKDDRRSNVAITRARRHCCLFLNSETLERHTFLKELTDFCYEIADIRTADEYLVDDLSVIDQFVEEIKNDNIDGNDDEMVREIEILNDGNVDKKSVLKNNDGDTVKKGSKGMNRGEKKKWRKKQKQRQQQEQCDELDDDDNFSGSDMDEQHDGNERNDNVIHTENDVRSLLNSLEQQVDGENKSKGKKKNNNIQYKNRKNKGKQNLKENKNKKMKDGNKNKKKQQYMNKNKGNTVKIKDDLSDILVDVNAKICYFVGCKKKVHLIKIQCKFCGRIFCIGHGPPIFHSEQCAKKQKFKIEQKKKESLKEINKMQYNEKNNIKVLKCNERNKLKKTLREKIEKKENERVQKSVRKKVKQNKNKKNKPKKKINRRKTFQ